MNVDRENGILHDVVLMTTLINKNDNFNFTSNNLNQVKNIGEKKKIYSYLGHAKSGISSDDRLPFRIGFFENYHIENNDTLKADLVLSPTIDENPILTSRVGKMSDYIFSIAENDSDNCGMSVSINVFNPSLETFSYENDITITNVHSIDLVENPALTLALFSADINKNMNTDITTVDPSLTNAANLFNGLDDTLKKGETPKPEDVQALISELINVFPQVKELHPDSEDPAQDAQISLSEDPVDVAVVTTPEDPSEDAEDTISPDIASWMQKIETLIEGLISKLDAPAQFSVDEHKPEVIQFSAPIAEERHSVNHMANYHALRSEGRYTEAAKYFADNCK